MPTAFQRAVIDAVAGLAPGELVTYGELAVELGRPGGGQAVANVLRAAPGLPWWRVLPADGRLYRSHAPVQAPLLAAEGHRVDELPAGPRRRWRAVAQAAAGCGPSRRWRKCMRRSRCSNLILRQQSRMSLALVSASHSASRSRSTGATSS